ncbi:hypothetical protein B0H14DRAFT_1406643 [Mycena olivaceomarginata]|nr:hypothetical protein B0H14DRAFT_1406643 [Mycena olivaceomarginata]
MIEDRWLRAGTCALSFSVLGHAPNQFGATAIRTTLLRHAHRLPTRFLTRLVDIGPFPVLETFVVANPFDNVGFQQVGNIRRCTSAAEPHLYRSWRTLQAPLLLPRVIRGGLRTSSPNVNFDVVLSAPLLEDSDFTGCVENRPVTRHTGVTHASLRTLCLSRGGSLDFLQLLRQPGPQKSSILPRISSLTSVAIFFRSPLAHPHPYDASPRALTSFP